MSTNKLTFNWKLKSNRKCRWMREENWDPSIFINICVLEQNYSLRIESATVNKTQIVSRQSSYQMKTAFQHKASSVLKCWFSLGGECEDLFAILNVKTTYSYPCKNRSGFKKDIFMLKVTEQTILMGIVLFT